LFSYPSTSFNFVIILILGTQYAEYGKYSFDFERKIKLKLGMNDISLLGVTVGLAVSLIFMVVILLLFFPLQIFAN
jgi:hypothetical protein